MIYWHFHGNMVKSYLVKLIFRIIEFANTQMYLPSIHAKGIPSYLMQKKSPQR